MASEELEYAGAVATVLQLLERQEEIERKLVEIERYARELREAMASEDIPAMVQAAAAGRLDPSKVYWSADGRPIVFRAGRWQLTERGKLVAVDGRRDSRSLS